MSATARRDASLAAQAAGEICREFLAWHDRFRAITRRAAGRFEGQDWHGAQADAVERLDLHTHAVSLVVDGLRDALGDRFSDRSLWGRIRDAYSAHIAAPAADELARTFFNSVTRRAFATDGVDPAIEYVVADPLGPEIPDAPPPCDRHPRDGPTVDLIRRLLAGAALRVPWEDLERDARLVAERVDARVAEAWGAGSLEGADVLRPLFFRRKGAYRIARLRSGDRILPLVIALLNRGGRLAVDAVLLTEDEVSIVFSFTRSYFHADLEDPHGAVSFLKSILPLKPVAELYIALGYNKHGKTKMYRHLMHHLGHSTDRFEIAPGDAGMVMVVFTLPSYDLVFKVIRDRFSFPKTTTREQVMARYELVFRHDRAGRLVDAQEFEHLAFAADRFSADLLSELASTAAASVRIAGGVVAIRHLYVERRVVPLNLFLRGAAGDAAREAVLDYGQTIKDLAATNIFPGDLLLKNFGVTRHGRVIFYDYDELCLLSECTFRDLPQAADYEDELRPEPWFYVAPSDIFPQEFEHFLGLEADLRETFLLAHGDLLTPSYWRRMQERHRVGEVIDIYPYGESRRLRPARGRA